MQVSTVQMAKTLGKHSSSKDTKSDDFENVLKGEQGKDNSDIVQLLGAYGFIVPQVQTANQQVSATGQNTGGDTQTQTAVPELFMPGAVIQGLKPQSMTTGTNAGVTANQSGALLTENMPAMSLQGTAQAVTSNTVQTNLSAIGSVNNAQVQQTISAASPLTITASTAKQQTGTAVPTTNISQQADFSSQLSQIMTNSHSNNTGNIQINTPVMQSNFAAAAQQNSSAYAGTNGVQMQQNTVQSLTGSVQPTETIFSSAQTVQNVTGSVQTAQTSQVMNGSVQTVQTAQEAQTAQAAVSNLTDIQQNAQTVKTESNTLKVNQAQAQPAAVTGTSTVQGAAKAYGGKSSSDNNSGSDDKQKNDNGTAQSILNAAQTNRVDTKDVQFSQTEKANAANQVANAAKQAVDSGHSEIRLHLSPEDLGGINIKIVSQNGSLTLQITADNSSTGQLLQSSMHELTQSMQNQGLTLGKAEVTYSSDNGFGASMGQQQQQQADSQNQNFKMPKWTTITQDTHTMASDFQKAEDSAISILA